MIENLKLSFKILIIYHLVVDEVEAGLQGREGEHAGGEGDQQLVHVPQGQILLSLGAYQASQEGMSGPNVVSLKKL